MTADQWLACDEPRLMIEALGRDASERKLRLYACACCRRVRELLPDPCRAAVAVAERYADLLATPAELAAAVGSIQDSVRAARRRVDEDPSLTISESYLLADAGLVAVWAVQVALSLDVRTGLPLIRTDSAEDTHRRFGPGRTRADAHRPAAPSAQAAILRDLFADRYRFVVPEHAWFTADVMALANTIYEGHAFEHMPILADALQDAGCDSAEVLDHCRAEAGHARGCWVLDLILGKV